MALVAVMFNFLAESRANEFDDFNAVSDRVLWLKADSLQLNDGDPVETWPDASGLDRDAVQGITAEQPTFIAEGLNGLPSLRFDDGNAQSLLLHANTFLDESSNPFTAVEVFVVVRTDDLVSSHNGLWEIGTHTVPTHYPDTDGYIYDDFGSSTSRGPISTTQALDQFHVYNVSSSSGQWTARIAGTVVEDDTGANVVAFAAAPKLGVSGSDYFSGEIAEVVVYSRVLSEAERAFVNAYLSAKYFTSYTLAVADDGNGSVGLPSGSYSPMKQLQLSATPATGYLFSHWEVTMGDEADVSDLEDPNAIARLTGDLTVNAVFIDRYEKLKEGLIYYSPLLDGIIADITGNFTVAPYSSIVFADGYFGEAGAVDVGQGPLKITGPQGGGPNPTEAMTLAISYSLNSSASEDAMFGGYDGHSNSNETFSLMARNNSSIDFLVRDAAGSSWHNIKQNVPSSLNVWESLAYSYSPATNFRAYRNGVLAGDPDITEIDSEFNDSMRSYPSMPVAIGDENDGGGRRFNGLVSDVMVWDRVLREDEVSALNAILHDETDYLEFLDSFTHYSDNSAPQLSPIASQEIRENFSRVITASATDSNEGQSLTYSLIEAPSWVTINEASGEITLSPLEVDGPSNATITVRVTDDAVVAKSDEATFTVRVLEEIDFVDSSLEAALRDALGINDVPLTDKDLETLTGSLDLSGLGIYDLSGLEYATNLTSLNLDGNRLDISDGGDDTTIILGLVDAGVVVSTEGQARFTLTLSSNDSDWGSVSVKPQQADYAYGEAVELAAASAYGYRFSAWGNDWTGDDNPVDFVVTDNNNILAMFVPALWEFDAPAGLVGLWHGNDNSIDEISGVAGVFSQDADYSLGKVGNGFRFNGATACEFLRLKRLTLVRVRRALRLSSG